MAYLVYFYFTNKFINFYVFIHLFVYTNRNSFDILCLQIPKLIEAGMQKKRNTFTGTKNETIKKNYKR